MWLVCASAQAAHRGGDDSALAAAQRAREAHGAGNYTASVRLYRASLTRPVDSQGPATWRADTLSALGESLRQLERNEESADILEQALRAYSIAGAVDTAAAARTRQRLAAVRLLQGRPAAARTQLELALGILGEGGEPSPDRSGAFEGLGDLAYSESRYEDADALYVRAAREAERALGPASLEVASALRARANALIALGRITEASTESARAVAVAEAQLAPSHPELANYLNDAAICSWYRGDYSTARRQWEKALRTFEARFGASHARTVTTLNNLALLAKHFGDFDAAISLESRVIAIRRRELGSTHSFVGLAIGELARMYIAKGDDRQARALFEQALGIQVRRLGPAHAETIDSHLELARLAIGRHDLVSARRHLSAAEGASTAAAEAVQPNALAMAALRGEIAAAVGDVATAAAEFQRAADGYVRAYGATHPAVATLRAREAEIRLAAGDLQGAARRSAEGETVVRDHLRVAMRDLSERLALSYEATRPPALDVLVSAALASSETELAASALTELTRSRGQVFDELVERRRPRGDVSPVETRLRETLQEARSRWANLAIRGPMGDGDNRHAAVLAGARDAVEAAERALAEESAEFRRTRVRKEATVDDIRAGLPEGATLVSFVRYGRRIPLPVRPADAPPVAPPAPVPSYVAIVTSRSSAPVLVDLGVAASLDRLVATWRDEAARGVTKAGRTPRQAERAYRRAGAALRARVWDPLAAHVTGATRILVVPDGALQAVAFAPLPVGTDRYLADSELAFHYLTTERDVMRPAATEQAEPSLLAVGGVDFGGTRSVAPSAPAAAPAPGATRAPQAADLMRLPINADGCLGFDEIEFPALPATAQEAREVEQMWRATGGTALRLSGGQARERRIRELAPRQRMLHFATHGFFLDSTCAGTAAAGARSVRKRVRPGTPTGAPAVGPASPTTASSGPSKATATAKRAPINPLALSGLAFADANSHAATTRGEDDGVLTAEEVAALDLQGVEWVVLSACDTGLGPIRAREGVLGLRRAFEVAGARTVIMSLWSVEDRTTRLWMRELYRSRLQGRRDTIDSIRDANRVMLEGRRATGATTHPYYWAGFVATGDWR